MEGRSGKTGYFLSFPCRRESTMSASFSPLEFKVGGSPVAEGSGKPEGVPDRGSGEPQGRGEFGKGKSTSPPTSNV